jgi:putative superfamily III holin-X
MNTDYQNGDRSPLSESVWELMRGIFRDARTLSIKEFTAAKLEIRQEITRAILSSVSLCVGLFLLATGLLLFSLVIALVLAHYFVVPLWESLGIVGATYCVVGVVVILASRSKIKRTHPIPQQTLHSTKLDAHHIRDKATGH